MFERVLPFFLCLMLLLGSGCSRSYDGTVIIPKPLDARRFWDKPPPPYAQAEPPPPEIAAFPVAPETPKRLAARRTATPVAPVTYMTRASNKPPMLSSEPTNPLTCRNVSEAGKRIRMVCQ
jgi:hypothetical protein